MKKKYQYTFQISIVSVLMGYIFMYLTLFLFYENQSFSSYNKMILSQLQENIIAFFTLGILWYFLIVYMIVSKVITLQMWKLDENNAKLKNYNHFLAHELKTPISVIQTNLEVLKYWFDSQKIESSLSELKNMNAIIEGLLDFSESIQKPQEGEFNLENILKKHTWIFGKDVEIQIINKEFNKTLVTDEVLFSRVIKNLFENAAKYMTGKQLFIEISEDSLIISNYIDKEFGENELNALLQIWESSAVLSRDGHGLWLAMIQQILKNLWYSFEISSDKNMFRAKITL